MNNFSCANLDNFNNQPLWSVVPLMLTSISEIQGIIIMSILTILFALQKRNLLALTALLSLIGCICLLLCFGHDTLNMIMTNGQVDAAIKFYIYADFGAINFTIGNWTWLTAGDVLILEILSVIQSSEKMSRIVRRNSLAYLNLLITLIIGIVTLMIVLITNNIPLNVKVGIVNECISLVISIIIRFTILNITSNVDETLKTIILAKVFNALYIICFALDSNSAVGEIFCKTFNVVFFEGNSWSDFMSRIFRFLSIVTYTVAITRLLLKGYSKAATTSETTKVSSTPAKTSIRSDRSESNVKK